MRLGVIGAGPVGLVTAGSFCSLGHEVICVENEPIRLEQLRSGQLPIYEPGLEELIHQGIEGGSLRFTDSMHEVLEFAAVVFVCVGTPPGTEGEADLSQVEAMAVDIAGELSGYRLLIEKSTVPIGTHKYISDTISKHVDPGIDFEVACVPEFLREGSAVQDFFNPQRIILGVLTSRGRALAEEVYKDFDCPKIWTDPGTAELTKHASNAFLAMKVSFANLLADVCEATGADPESLLEGVCHDPRIGRKFMNPGVGYGGSCLPKDVSAFIHLAGAVGVDASVLTEVNRINKARPGKVLEFIRGEINDLSGAKIAIWGLSFKPNTDDVRNAPSIEVVRLLLEAGASVRCHDPVAIGTFSEVIDKHPKLELVEDMYATIEGSNCLVLLTEWSQYREADLSRVSSIMSNPFIVDGRQAIDQITAERLGFIYLGIGRRLAQNNGSEST